MNMLGAFLLTVVLLCLCETALSSSFEDMEQTPQNANMEYSNDVNEQYTNRLRRDLHRLHKYFNHNSMPRFINKLPRRRWTPTNDENLDRDYEPIHKRYLDSLGDSIIKKK
ncbi:hypothetical protein HELRODRAFT_161036 [Helobdella robusta]|uniref:Uncharacterized protein n=1 Tax=Helobdella robusta TaxID=6412 RepID=T1ER15_HELRO|nr:hypothetical protein HELRODRAFT_161036 [Helobdella robusta]ESO01857.1 hypothetical protein HELRODRAFT_161036 [Helobdella robusta]